MTSICRQPTVKRALPSGGPCLARLHIQELGRHTLQLIWRTEGSLLPVSMVHRPPILKFQAPLQFFSLAIPA